MYCTTEDSPTDVFIGSLVSQYLYGVGKFEIH